MYSVLCVLLYTGLSAATDPSLGKNSQCDWLLGNGNLKPVGRFPVLPGGGWDHLRNRDMGPVVDLSLSDCTLSVDGLYVIPDQVTVYPIKESRISLMSNVIEHYNNYSSATSRSVNVGGGGSFFDGMFGVDGKYSDEFQEVKSTALYSKTQIGRTQQRYDMYVARVVPDFRLSESFKNRLMDIGNSLINNQTGQARYLSDLLVRDFGTHVVTSLNAGAVLEKVDYFKQDSLSTAVYTTNKISQCLSVNFLDVFGLDSSVTLAVSTEELNGYKKTVQKTAVNTHGGPAMDAKIDLTKWKNGLKQNLVAIDRVGDLLFTVIRHRSLPQLQTLYLKGVIDSVKDAVTRYYKMNEVKGCLDPDSPNFEPLANVEGSCVDPMTNFSFGGVYQTCQQFQSEPVQIQNVCGQQQSPMQVNYITGGYSCPDGYEPTLLMSIIGVRQQMRFWFLSIDYWTVLNSYWCVARRDRKLPSQSGALYGGAYSPRFNNPATGAKTCGAYYQPYSVGRDITFCVSADMTYGPRSRVPLGGFFTCVNGNPLAEPGRPVVAEAPRPPPRSGLAASPSPPPPPPPKRCPDGFTQAALDVVDGCELMQCARLGAAELRRRGVARRPPYEEPPGEWATLSGAAIASMAPSLPAASSSASGVSATPIILSCVALVVLVLAVAISVALVRRKSAQRQQRQRGLYVESGSTATEEQPLLGEGNRDSV